MLIANKIFYVTVLLLIYFCDQSVASEIVTADVTASLRQGQDFDKKFVFEEVHSKKVDRQISREKLDKA